MRRRVMQFGFVLVAAMVLMPTLASAAEPRVSGPAGSLALIAGKNRTVAPGPATASPIGAQAVAVDSAGNAYVADTTNNVVEKVTPSGTLSIVAGLAGHSGSPTPGPAVSSELNQPDGVAVDSSGDVYISDQGNDVVEKVTPAGTLAIVAGTGTSGAPAPGPATSSDLNGPTGVAVDSSGNLYIADQDNNVVEKVTPAGTLSIVAGTGASGTPTPGPAISSSLNEPAGLAVDRSGNLYIADRSNYTVEKVTPSGTLSIVAGTGSYGSPTPGTATSSDLASPSGVSVDSTGDVYIADFINNVVEKVTPSGTLSIVAGTPGRFGAPTPGPATSSDLGLPSGVAVDSSGNLYIADGSNDVVEKIAPAGTLSIAAGTRTSGAPTPGPATASDLSNPGGVAVDSSGNVYIADGSNDVVEKVTPVGTLSIAAGTGTPGAPTPGPATRSALNGPAGVAVDTSGNLYIADGSVVERVTPAGTLTIVAGTGSSGAPTPGPATSSNLNGAAGVAVDRSGNLYIADSGNSDVEKVTPAGTLSIVAGLGPQNTGEPTPGPATGSRLGEPAGVAVDNVGNLYIADALYSVVEKVTPAGTLSIAAGIAYAGKSGYPNPPTPGPATSSYLDRPSGVTVDGSGNLYIADTGNGVVEKVTPAGTLSVLAGTGLKGAPTPGPAISSDLDGPTGVAADSSGDVYIADAGNSDVEEVFGSGSPPTDDPTTTSVRCVPRWPAVGRAARCTATVTDAAATAVSSPSGSVSFASSPASGAFSGSGSCQLAATGTTGAASCEVSFTPLKAGSYVVTGSFGGDGSHRTSAGASSIVARARHRHRHRHWPLRHRLSAFTSPAGITRLASQPGHRGVHG